MVTSGKVLQTSNVGGLLNTSDLLCQVGDGNLDRQKRSFLHYITTRLPDTAVISQVTVQVKINSIGALTR